MAVHAEVLYQRSLVTQLRRYVRNHWGGYLYSELIWFVGGLVGVTVTGVAVMLWRDLIPVSWFLLTVVLIGSQLGMRMVLVTYAYVLAWCAFLLVHDHSTAMPAGVASCLGVMFVMLFAVHSREQVGLSGMSSATLLLDLRDRLREVGQLPRLPQGWRGEAVLRSAHGEGFSGDFIVAALADDASALEVAVVDVSGKGSDAGARALQLQSAFSGMLGSIPSADFLAAANAYLLRQQWEEGFATAIQIRLDLATGACCVYSAGHPPAVRLDQGAGLWRTVAVRSGPLLGIVNGVSFPCQEIHLERGDALLLYTDGVIEARDGELADGIDRLAGIAESRLRDGLSGLADRLCRTARGGSGDDRAVVALWRE